MLRILRVDTSNPYIYISMFARQGPFSQVWSHTIRDILYQKKLYNVFNWFSNIGSMLQSTYTNSKVNFS